MYDWKYRIYCIVPWNLRQEANALARYVDFDSGGDRTFGDLRLSPNGLEPVTHTGCNGVIPKEAEELQDLFLAIKNQDSSAAIDAVGTEGLNIKAKIVQVMDERNLTKNQVWNVILQCKFYFVRNYGPNDGNLVFTTAGGTVGQPFTFQDALTDAGLQEITSEVI